MSTLARQASLAAAHHMRPATYLHASCIIVSAAMGEWAGAHVADHRCLCRYPWMVLQPQRLTARPVVVRCRLLLHAGSEQHSSEGLMAAASSICQGAPSSVIAARQPQCQRPLRPSSNNTVRSHSRAFKWNGECATVKATGVDDRSAAARSRHVWICSSSVSFRTFVCDLSVTEACTSCSCVVGGLSSGSAHFARTHACSTVPHLRTPSNGSTRHSERRLHCQQRSNERC